MTPIFPATIRSGKLHFDNLEQFKDYLQTFPDEKRVEVTVEKSEQQAAVHQDDDKERVVGGERCGAPCRGSAGSMCRRDSCPLRL
jgi:hypothetical protein